MLRTFLQRQRFSKRTISAIKHNGALIVNGESVTVRAQLKHGDVLEVLLADETPSTNLLPYKQPLTILYEDPYLIAVSKSANQNCAPSRDHLHYSVAEQVLGYFQAHETTSVPHIITRLDRNTSGIVIIAKHGFIHHLMSQTQIDKQYLCVCRGEVARSDLIDAPIARHPDSIIQRCVDENGKKAQTRFERLDVTQINRHTYSLCAVTLLTGRTHQIRVHFQHIGHPLVGDDLYGGAHDEYAHQLLRCRQVTFNHPINNQKIIINDKYDAIESIFNML